MTLWKAWFDVRRKFWLSAVLVTLLVGPGAVATAVGAGGPSGRGPAGRGSSDEYRAMLEGWISGDAHMVFTVLAIVLAVGGITAQTTASSNLMTLSLPESRRRWMTAHALVALALLGALCLWEAAILAVTGWTAGVPVPLGRLALAVLLTTASAAPWIWPSVLFTSITRDAIRAALIVVSVVVTLATLARITGSAFFDFGLLANPSVWRDGPPLEPLGVAAAVPAVSAWAALGRFRRMEY